MRVMHAGQQVRATHSLTSSHPSGWVVSRGSRGVVTRVVNTEPLLYSAQFQVFDGVSKVVTVTGISSRDIVPSVPAQHVVDQSLSKAS